MRNAGMKMPRQTVVILGFLTTSQEQDVYKVNSCFDIRPPPSPLNRDVEY